MTTLSDAAPDPSLILTLSCPDASGLVAAVSGFLADQGCNISDAQQFGDPESGRFFMRVVLQGPDAEALRQAFAPLAQRHAMDWTLRGPEPRRVMILTSRFDHCLADLLYRWRIDELPMTITGIVSNHERSRIGHVDLGDLPFHHMPVDPARKAEQEARLLALIEETGTELVVLARYMQILSPALCARLSGRCINIHHSFLPSFKGARPYHQAFERGVKIIGATAHYVTTDLDEGPIIEQGVHRVDHSHTPDDLVTLGRDVECTVLARAVTWHVEHRVLIAGVKTVVFA